MPTSKILPLTRFRGRRERRRDRAYALHVADRHRDRLMRHLWRALDLVSADRAATVWVDEYGPGVVHPHSVLDVAFDEPRTDFSVELMRLTWGRGVPGVVDASEPSRSGHPSGSAPPRSAFVVSLGSDGLRAWFMVVDSLTARSPLGEEIVEELLFLAGECAAVVLHRDMDRSAGASGRQEFGAWPVLRDAAEGPIDEHVKRRVACRFVVARVVRAFLEDDMAVAREELEERVEGARAEIAGFSRDDGEARSWDEVLDALLVGDRPALVRALQRMARAAEDHGHWHGAIELYGAAGEAASRTGQAGTWLDASRALGRCWRKLGEWEEALRWYGLARETARAVGDASREARAMDGEATVHIVRGNVPAARRILDEAVPVAEAGVDPDARGAVYHSLMTVTHTEGDLDGAARFGWRAVREYREEEGSLRALTALGGVFLEARELDGAEDAFTIVAARVRDQVFKLYSLAGLALVAAHRREPDRYRARLSALEEAGFEKGPPELRAEVLLECGDGFLVLGDDAEARRWYERAVGVAEEHGVNEYLIRAEQAIDRLDRVSPDQAGDEEDAPKAPILERRELEEIRGDLDRMRREAVASYRSPA